MTSPAPSLAGRQPMEASLEAFTNARRDLHRHCEPCSSLRRPQSHCRHRRHADVLSERSLATAAWGGTLGYESEVLDGGQDLS